MIQIRYADTPQQKNLKQHTTAARQFRSAEYEYATQNWRRYDGPGQSEAQNEFENFLTRTVRYAHKNSDRGLRTMADRVCRSPSAQTSRQGQPHAGLFARPYLNGSYQNGRASSTHINVNLPPTVKEEPVVKTEPDTTTPSVTVTEVKSAAGNASGTDA